MNGVDRFNDLQRQGFMKARKPKPAPIERPIVACDECLNWHKQGKHTADRVTRATNRVAAR